MYNDNNNNSIIVITPSETIPQGGPGGLGTGDCGDKKILKGPGEL